MKIRYLVAALLLGLSQRQRRLESEPTKASPERRHTGSRGARSQLRPGAPPA